MRNVLIALSLAACAQAEPIAGEVELMDELPPFSRVFTPDFQKLSEPDDRDMALSAMTSAAARWSSATGRDIHIGEGGIPMVAWPSLFAEYRDDGRTLLSPINHGGTMHHLCGLSTWNEEETGVRIIDFSMPYLGCDPEWAATHELWHALVGVKGHMEAGIGAAGDDPDRSPEIDAASLQVVCSVIGCSSPSPESP